MGLPGNEEKSNEKQNGMDLVCYYCFIFGVLHLAFFLHCRGIDARLRSSSPRQVFRSISRLVESINATTSHSYTLASRFQHALLYPSMPYR